jgi:tetrahydromethanopterin S-methyltransferase subunit F
VSLVGKCPCFSGYDKEAEKQTSLRNPEMGVIAMVVEEVKKKTQLLKSSMSFVRSRRVQSRLID